MQNDPGTQLSNYAAMTLGACIAPESEEYTALAADISTYIDSLIPQFITGERPLSDIPAVQEQIRSWDVDRCIELWQEALDRYNA